jgi:UDP-N-acetylglucosamine 1-carboxyvinyltransferase
MKIVINGAKNSILPILCICCIQPLVYTINNVTFYNDVLEMIDYLKELNIKTIINGNILYLDSSNIIVPTIIKKKSNIRAIYYFYSVLSKYKKRIEFPYPSGCNIGDRKIDMHINFFNKFNILVKKHHNSIIIDSRFIKEQDIIYEFDKVSIGATINAIYTSVNSNSKVILNNCSIDPYILNVIESLNNININITLKNRQIIIYPKTDIKTIRIIRELSIIPDPIISGTFIIMLVLHKKNDILISNLILKNLGEVYNLFTKIGIKFIKKENNQYYIENNLLKKFDIETSAFPGIYTDLMPFLVVLASTIGNCSIQENIMNNRFKFTDEIKKLNFKYDIYNNKICVHKNLFKKVKNKIELCCTDLRGGMAILIYITLFLKEFPNNQIILNKYNYICRGYFNVKKIFMSFGIYIIDYNKSSVIVSGKPINLHSTFGL